MVFNNNLLLGVSGQTTGQAPFDSTLIGNSVWFDGSSDQLEMAKTSGGSASSKFTVSCWVQRNEFAEGTFTGIFNHFFSSNTGVQLTWLNADTLTFIVFSSTSGAGGQVTSSGVFRDIGWYHILGNYDGTNGRMELFVNGESIGIDTFTAGSTNPIGSGTSGASYFWGACANTQGTFGRTNSYLAQCALELGTAAVPSDYVDTFTFGTNGSQVIPKVTSDLVSRINSAGGHSHLLDFADSSNLGNDISSNNNDFTATSMSSANQTLHTPSLSYPIFNALSPTFTGGGTWSEGNTKIVSTSEATSAITTLPPISTGKYYFQWVFTDNASSGNCTVGMTPISHWNGKTVDPFASGDIFYADHRNANFTKGSTTVNSILGSSGTYALCFDLDAGKVWVGLVDTSDGSISWYNSSGGTTGDPANGTNPTATFTANTSMVPFTVIGKASGTSWTVDWNFGQFGFGNSVVPTGFEQITSTKVTTPVYQGIDYFDSTIYEGNGTGQRVGDFVPFTDIGTISQSVAFNLADSDKLTIASSVSTTPTNVQKKTISVWLKPWKVGENFIMVGKNGSDSERIYTTSAGQLQYLTISGGGSTAHVSTNGAFVADPSQWVHVVFGIDYTDGSTEADRVKIYVNGVQITDLANTSYPANNMTSAAFINKASTEQIIGKHPSTSGGDASNFSDMYYAEYYMVDGLQLTPSTFGQLDTSTNRWVAKSTSTVTSAISSAGGFGNCGFYLNFSNTSDYGEDSSGNNRDFTESGVLDATNQFTDTPSKNYPIVDTGLKFGSVTPSVTKGGLRFASGGDGGGRVITMQPTSGKWYFEIELTNTTGFYPGLITPAAFAYTGSAPWNETSTFVILSDHPSVRYNNGGTGGSDWGAVFSNGDRMAVAWDVPNKKIYFGKAASSSVTWMSSSGASGGNPATGVGAVPFTPSMTERLYFAMMFGSNSTDATMKFISSGWEGAAPTGFSELNQDNLDDTASKLTAWAWIKNRDAEDSHILVDRVRGVGEVLHSDLTDLEATETNTVQRFLQRGVQVGSDVQVNTANESYVLWQWLVGEAATTTTINASSTTPTNSIASTVAAADAGHFSVVGYQGNSTNGATVAHSLGGEPELIFFRGREGSGASSFLWRVFSTTGGAGKYLRLNDSTGLQDDTGYLNNTLPGSVVFTLGTDGDVNNSSFTYIAYCFRSVPGVCKIGTYEANNVSNGPYISTGFKVATTITKPLDASGSWMILDDKREPENPVQKRLFPNSNADEDVDGDQMDFYSEGFKLRKAGGHNGSGTYLYLAMADIGGNGTLPPIYGR